MSYIFCSFSPTFPSLAYKGATSLLWKRGVRGGEGMQRCYLPSNLRDLNVAMCTCMLCFFFSLLEIKPQCHAVKRAVRVNRQTDICVSA
jgi:hypothetical protein